MTRLLLCTFPALLSALIAGYAAVHAIPSNPLRGGIWLLGSLMAFSAMGLAIRLPWASALFLAATSAAVAAAWRSISAVPADPAGWSLLASAVAACLALLLHQEVRQALLFPDDAEDQGLPKLDKAGQQADDERPSVRTGIY